jgi:hypothetical protein
MGLKRKPSIIQVSRPKTSSGSESRVSAWVQQELDRRLRNDSECKLALFPRPSTSHSLKAEELKNRPLPPLPPLPVRAKTAPPPPPNQTTSASVSGTLRRFRRQLSLFFGKRKHR